MRKLNISAIALAIGISFSAGAMAETMSKDEYKATKSSISAAYESDKAACESLSGNRNDICVAKAKGVEGVAVAELESRYKPSREATYKVSVAKADANYATANERCDNLAGNAKDVCVKEAKAARTTTKADAKAQLKTVDASDKAIGKAMDAHEEASADKREAQYAVDKEKCDGFADGAKDNCMAQAKTRYGK